MIYQFITESMETKFLDYLVMYYEIKRLREEEHYSLGHIAEFLGMNFRTVKKYLSMTPDEFEVFVGCKFHRSSLLEPYKDFILSCLGSDSNTPCSVIHDKLKEHFHSFPDIHTKTIYNYVMRLRSDYGLFRSESTSRQYFPIADLPAGSQAQVDFGQKKLRGGDGQWVSVYFFAMVLCYSRYKFVFFRQDRFTSHSAVEAHEKAFEYFGGIPREIIYDQDCVFIHQENRGDYVMTDEFTRYQACRPFKVTYCRKSDPQSKGKIENVIKYVKYNFLYNRPFSDIHLLNVQALEWLGRTGNKMLHNSTRKIPFEQWKYEQPFLLTWHPVFTVLQEKRYKVHKTNVVKYKGNSYSLPLGTYKGESSHVYLIESEGDLVIRDDTERTLATHRIPIGVGNNIVNNNHRRNKSMRINELREKVREFFRHSSSIDEFISIIDRLYPRYVRDQLTLLLTCCEKAGLQRSEETLEFCLRNHVASCNDFKSVLENQKSEGKQQVNATPLIKPIGDAQTRLISVLEPSKSDIDEYETLFLTPQKNIHL